MNKINSFILLVLIFSSIILKAQKASELFKAQIPADWEVLDEQYGDLNKDSIADAAVVTQEKGEGTAEFGRRDQSLFTLKIRMEVINLLRRETLSS